ncbi:hypothetical protein B4135_0927 [Caldibacillus debilis]|uniref:Uncharacterized protein n=1 Tax=Caldibacillus debilis TaxID=301148 RepID=A0A150M672_9BACI|nr:hypothetical protein B4135_0927 [Caldibacillus debilis]
MRPASSLGADPPPGKTGWRWKSGSAPGASPGTGSGRIFARQG